MAENRRDSPRFFVSLYTERNEPEATPIRIRDLSASGFLVRGSVLAGHGGIFHATFRVRPSSGETKVSVRGKVVRSRIDGRDSEFGIKIEGFGSPEEESAYQAYVRELAARQAARSSGDLS